MWAKALKDFTFFAEEKHYLNHERVSHEISLLIRVNVPFSIYFNCRSSSVLFEVSRVLIGLGLSFSIVVGPCRNMGLVCCYCVVVPFSYPLMTHVLNIEYVNAQNFKHAKTVKQKKELSRL